jgi:hypothetical protein
MIGRHASLMSMHLEVPVSQSLQYWFDASDDATVLTESGTNKVDWWVNRTGNRSAPGSETTTPQQDKTNKAINFGVGGTRSYLRTLNSDFPANLEEHTVFVVGKADGSHNHSFFEIGTGTVNTGLSLFRESGINKIRIVAGGTSQDVVGGDFSAKAIHVSHYKNNVLDYYTNQTLNNSKTISGATKQASSLHLGSLAHNSFFLVGPINEFLFYDRHLTTSELSEVHDYLKNKHSIVY